MTNVIFRRLPSSQKEEILKDNGTVNISMLDSRATSGDAEQILAELEQSVSEVAQERELHIAAATNVEPDIQFVVDRGDQPDPNQGDPGNNQGNPDDPQPTDGDPDNPDDPSNPCMRSL